MAKLVNAGWGTPTHVHVAISGIAGSNPAGATISTDMQKSLPVATARTCPGNRGTRKVWSVATAKGDTDSARTEASAVTARRDGQLFTTVVSKESQMESVYELVDVSDDEVYYPLGLFLSVQDAIDAVEKHFSEKSEPPHEGHYDDGDVISLEVRKRDIGLAAVSFKAEWSRKWQRVWDDDDFSGDGRWVEKPESTTEQ